MQLKFDGQRLTIIQDSGATQSFILKNLTTLETLLIEYLVGDSARELDPPSISPAGGIVSSTQSVTMSGPYAADIYYTTDGEDPTTESTKYSSTISVTQTTTVKAFAHKEGYTDSDIVSQTYEFKVVTPVITVESTSATIATTTADATIYYTIDGTDPTSESTEYTDAIDVSAVSVVKAIAVKTGWTNSDITTENIGG